MSDLNLHNVASDHSRITKALVFLRNRLSLSKFSGQYDLDIYVCSLLVWSSCTISFFINEPLISNIYAYAGPALLVSKLIWTFLFFIFIFFTTQKKQGVLSFLEQHWPFMAWSKFLNRRKNGGMVQILGMTRSEPWMNCLMLYSIWIDGMLIRKERSLVEGDGIMAKCFKLSNIINWSTNLCRRSIVVVFQSNGVADDLVRGVSHWMSW